MAKRAVIFLSIFLVCGLLEASSRAEECFSFIQEQLNRASQQLDEVSHQEGVVKINEGVYVKILKEGRGPDIVSEEDSPLVLLKAYELKPEGDDNPYVIDKPKRMDLNHCIPGIQAGMKGMRVGEIRRIYVHPSMMQGDFGPYSAYGAVVYYEIEVLSISKNQNPLH